MEELKAQTVIEDIAEVFEKHELTFEEILEALNQTKDEFSMYMSLCNFKLTREANRSYLKNRAQKPQSKAE